jgi:hypothetical protein
VGGENWGVWWMGGGTKMYNVSKCKNDKSRKKFVETCFVPYHMISSVEYSFVLVRRKYILAIGWNLL